MGVKLGLSHRSINKVKFLGEQITKMYIIKEGKYSFKMFNRSA